MENAENISGRNFNEVPESVKEQLEAEKKIHANVMSIRLTPDGISINENRHCTAEDYSEHLPGVYCKGVQYYDLSNVHYINNTGMAILIDLLKSLLEMGVEVQFVNVEERIKRKVRDMGLEKIINC